MIRLTTALFILCAGVLSIGLFWSKAQVQELESELVRLDRQIISERQAIRVLGAEWALLNDPARLRVLAEKYLDLQPVGAAQIVSIDAVDTSALREISHDR